MRRKQAANQRLFMVSKGVRGTCYMMSLLIFAYALVAGDVPAGMLSLSVIAGLTPPSGKVSGFSFGHEFQKMMFGFSLTLFFGAMVMMFF